VGADLRGVEDASTLRNCTVTVFRVGGIAGVHGLGFGDLPQVRVFLELLPLVVATVTV